MPETSSTRVAFTTLGCKVNQSETDTLARQFAAAGYDCVPFESAADVYVVNTCTVTHVADKKSRQLLSQARRNPGALVVVTGCYAS
ncbi:MAG TPA: tRNA (N(6)-L-threonylcarbamoyladenosine(37)-C(2))-methylthiotransferase MtaB, partial [Chloroflexota bacterium]